MQLPTCALGALLFLCNGARAQNSSSIYQTRFPGVTWDNELWRLTTTDLDQGHYQARASVANGYHGINVAALGRFSRWTRQSMATLSTAGR